jgi:hypothetical protein
MPKQKYDAEIEEDIVFGNEVEQNDIDLTDFVEKDLDEADDEQVSSGEDYFQDH